MSKWVKATFEYTPEPDRAQDEFPFKIGELIRVINQDDEGWWQGECDDGRKGFFPATYVVETDERPKGAKIEIQPRAPPPAAQKKAPPAAEKKGGGGGGGRGGGGAKKPKNSPTRYGVWATVSAKYVAIFYVISGVGMFLWKMFQGENAQAPYVGSPVNLRLWSAADGLIAFYFLCIGCGIFYYETKFGAPRGIWREGQTTPTSKPSYIRGLLYLFLSIPGYLTLLGLLAGALFLLPISLNFVTGYYNEIFIPRVKRSRSKKKNDEYDQESWTTKCYEFIAGKNPEGQFGRFVSMILYVCINIFVGIWAVDDAFKAKVQDTFTYWVHMAKFFGYIMDFNFSFLVLPVSRTLVRGIYNCATRETISCKARCFLCILRYVPLDEAFQIHKMFARVGFFSAVMHTIAHVINFGARSDAVDLKFGLNIWVTGVGLVTVMLFLYTCAHDSIKKSHFELFWGTHWLWPIFFTLCIMHGCKDGNTPRSRCWFGPHYWYWIIGPGAIFLLERLIREKMSRATVCLLSFTQMGDVGNGKKTTVLSLSVAKVGTFANEYREGQYAYIMCPPVSNFEWHPFTISSCPQQDDVTFHIRILAGGWTEQLHDTLDLFSKRGDPLTVLSHTVTGLQGMEKKPGREFSADGKRLLRIYGPHSAPTQHLTKYGEVFIVTSGIGVTPLNSCMKSVVLHRWKFSTGMTKPSRVHFFWVTQHAEIERFRWFIRTVKDVCDTLSDILQKGGTNDGGDPKMTKIFKFQIFLTRINEKTKESQNARLSEFLKKVEGPRRGFQNALQMYDDARQKVELARNTMAGSAEEKMANKELATKEIELESNKKAYTQVYQRFWGATPRDEKGLKTGRARFTEEQFYKSLCDAEEKGGVVNFEVTNEEKYNKVATIQIIPGRPKWEPFFDAVNKTTPYEDVGVCFCGNPFIGKLLEENCSKFSKMNKRTRKKLTWHLHQEVF